MGPVTPRAMGHMTNAVNMGTKTSLSICGMILSKNWYTYFSTSTVRMMGMLLDAYLTKGMGRPNRLMGEAPSARPAVMVGYSIKPAHIRASAVSVLNRFAADHAMKNGRK